MAKTDDARGEDMAEWLVESAKRARAPSAALAAAQPASPEDLVRYLEELTERKFRSRADVLRLLEDLMKEKLAEDRAARTRQVLRESILVGTLAAAFLHYQYWDINLQIVSLPAVQVFVPASSPAPSHRSQNTAYRA